jgi:hypothetical protein
MNGHSYFESIADGSDTLQMHPPIEMGSGISILDISGDCAELLYLMRASIQMEKWSPSAVLSIGFRYDGSRPQAHLLFITTVTSLDLNEVKAIVRRDVFQRHLREDFFYAHLLSAMAEDVNVGAFDKGFEQIHNANLVFADLIKTLFAERRGVHGMRALHGSKTGVTSLILVGRTGKRVVVGSKQDQLDLFDTISTPTTGMARYATVDESVFVVAEHGQSEVHGISVVMLAQYLEGMIDQIEWRSTKMDGCRIVELAIVDNRDGGKLLLTLDDGAYRYMPISVRFTDNVMNLELDTKRATPHLRGRYQPPIVRINARASKGRGYIAHVDRDSPTLIGFQTIASAAMESREFRQTAISVTNGDWQSSRS